MKKIRAIEAPAPELKKLRVCAYCRVLTDQEEQQESFSAQVEHYTHYIKNNPAWNFAGIYSDNAKSGKNKEKRPEFLRMVRDAESKKFDLIITKSIFRFARNQIDCLETVRKLKSIGIGICFENEANLIHKKDKWGLTSRRINYYCSSGPIKGAIKKGNLWLVPESARKPIDGRRSSSKRKGVKKMKRILVVEDDIMLNSGLCYNLQLDEYEAIPVHDAATALEKIRNDSFDLIILDVNLPDGDGFELCKKIKTVQDIPLVFLTARDLEGDVMAGFDLGADDYIIKPFNINIFRKKVAAVLRRSKKSVNQQLYVCGDLVIDFDKLAASVRDEPVVLTPTEYKILKIFASNPGLLLTRQVLLEKLYDVDANFVDEHALTVNINRLRSKIETGDRKYIRTVYGMGYVWAAGDKE